MERDLQVDEHHTIERHGYCVGSMFLGGIRGKKRDRTIRFVLPMDERRGRRCCWIWWAELVGVECRI